MVMFFSCFLFFILFIFNQTYAKEQTISSSLKTNCTLYHNNEILHEGDSIMIGTKLFKVEGCQLQRAYHACGTHLWAVINIVCGAIEVHKGKSKNYRHSSNRRFRRFTRENLLIEACCLTTCTINEMTRYCP